MRCNLSLHGQALHGPTRVGIMPAVIRSLVTSFTAAWVSIVGAHAAAADDGTPSPPPSTANDAPPSPPASDPPAFVIGSKGFGFESRDGASSFYTHWLVAGDFQSFISKKPPGVVSRDAFVVKSAGLQLDAVLHRLVHSQIFVDFAQSKTTLFDAWVQIEPRDWFTVRVGKFQFPINEERLTSPIALPFVSTGFASVLLPSRDIGVQVLGTLLDGQLRYNLALTDGAVAGTSIESDADSAKDLVARVFAKPFARTCWPSVRGLGIGVGASVGDHQGTPTNPNLPVLRTYGGQTFFAYRATGMADGTSIADGRVTRVVPHATWSWGPLAAYADYVHVSEHVAGATVQSDGWSVIPSLVLTGEQAAPLRFIVPKRPLDLARGQIGTVLLTGGVGSIHVSSSAFDQAADPNVAMQRATVIGGGVNWYPFAGIAILADYGYMRFTPFSAAPARLNEHTVIVRFEMAL